MLNKDNVRELAYLVYVDAIEPIEGKDRVEAAVVGGWRTMVRKGLFKPGDIGIYIEVDAKTPETEPFKFLEKYHYKVKTQKFKTFYSQGLLMHPSDFGWTVSEIEDYDGKHYIGIADNNKEPHLVKDESRFLTKQLGITYALDSDNKRKAPSVDKYKKMAQRHPDLFKKPFFRWMMKREWGKKVLFVFFGKAKDKKGGWPAWAKKTDEERCQNMPWLFTDPEWHDTLWFATEKIDGTSTTFTMKRGQGFKKPEYYICSRNVCFDTPDKEDRCFYASNVYTEMAKKYNVREVLEQILKDKPDLSFVTLQGETYGDGIQKRTYSTEPGEHKFMAFNLIYGYKDGTQIRYNPAMMTTILEKYGIPCVPIVDMTFHLPETCDELLEIAEGNSKVDGQPREGLVFRDENGERSFKAVSNSFLVRFHS